MFHNIFSESDFSSSILHKTCSSDTVFPTDFQITV